MGIEGLEEIISEEESPREKMFREQGHVAYKVTNLPPRSIQCACSITFSTGDVITKMKKHKEQMEK